MHQESITGWEEALNAKKLDQRFARQPYPVDDNGDSEAVALFTYARMLGPPDCQSARHHSS